MMSCSRTSLQPQRPTPLPHRSRRDRSGQTQLPAHLQLSYKATCVQKVLARLTQLNKQGLCKGSNRKGFMVK